MGPSPGHTPISGPRLSCSPLPCACCAATIGRATSVSADERTAILAALGESQDNRARAAEMLGMGRTAVLRKVKSLGIG